LVGRYPTSLPDNQTAQDEAYGEGLAAYFDKSIGDTIDKLRNFPKYVPQPELNRFLCRHVLFQKILEVHGSILECGVHLGGGLMSWAQFSAIYEPLNHVRKIVGFDTFQGFASVHEKDRAGNLPIEKGSLSAPALDDLREAVRLYDLGRTIAHISKVELVAGDACETIPKYLVDNPHLVIALLYLDFDVYEPTKIALQKFLPRMPKGAVLAFDELGIRQWPGETLAAVEVVGLQNLKLRRLPHHPQISYAVLE
jgi:Macrocin-O-methyltransferase (TylF)